MQYQSYIVTFEDGSEAYLEHHGVKGMKWGVWNAETRARRAGAKAEKAGRKALDAYNKLQGASNRQVNRPGFLSNHQVNMAANRYVRAQGKAATLGKKAGVADDPYGIRKQERDAYKYDRGLAMAQFLGGPTATALYAKKSPYRSAYEQVRSRAIRDTHEQAVYGKQKMQELLQASREGRVVGAVMDGKGNNTYVVKPKS